MILPTPSRTRRATLIGATAVLLWGALASLTVLSGPIPPFQLLAMCFTLATLVGLAAWRVLDAPRPDVPGPTPAVLALGVYGLFGYHFAYFMALRLAPPVEAGLIAYLWPLLIVLMAALLPGERLGGRQLAGALAGFAGAGLLITRGQRLSFDPQYAPGYGFALACAVIWSSYSVLSRLVVRERPSPSPNPSRGEPNPSPNPSQREGDRRSEGSPLVPSPPGRGLGRGKTRRPHHPVTLYCAVTAALAFVCHLIFEETVWPAGWQWAAVVALGLGPVGAAFYTWDYGVKRGDIQTLGALAYAAPLLSTLLLIALGLAEPSWVLAAACALIVGGAVVASGSFRRQRVDVEERETPA